MHGCMYVLMGYAYTNLNGPCTDPTVEVGSIASIMLSIFMVLVALSRLAAAPSPSASNQPLRWVTASALVRRPFWTAVTSSRDVVASVSVNPVAA